MSKAKRIRATAVNKMKTKNKAYGIFKNKGENNYGNGRFSRKIRKNRG